MAEDGNDLTMLGRLNLQAVLASTRDGYWQADFEQGRVYASHRLQEMLGNEAQEGGSVHNAEMPAYESVHPDDRERLRRDFDQMVMQRREELSHEYRLRHASGGWIWVQGRSRVLEWNDARSPRLMCGWISDISRRRHLEQALGALLERRVAEPLEQHLKESVRQLAQVLGMRFAHLGKLSEDGRRVRTVVAIRDGEIAADFEYEMAGSPCEVAVSESLCSYPRGVREHFPLDAGLVRLGIESYLGIGLRSRRGEAFGVLAAMHDGPLERSDIPEALITLFAERLARELELTETETALERRMRFAHQLLERTVNGIGILRELRSPGGTLEDLEWVQINPALAAHLGRECASPIGRRVLEIEGTCGRAVFEMACELEDGGTRERQIETENGRWFEVCVYRPEQGMIGLVTSDITERRMVEEATRESERRLRGVLANLSLAALVLDVEGSVRFANQAALDLVRCDESDLLGANWFEAFIPTDERTRIAAALDAAGGLSNCPPHVSNRVLRKDGKERLVEWDVHPLRGPGGEVEGIAAVGRDITDVRALQERARLAQRMDAIGRLAGGVAHDFNNLLTVINGYVRLSLNKTGDGPVKNYLTEIERAGGKATELTRQLLALSRKHVMQARDFEVHKTIREMEPLLARLLGSAVYIDFELSASNDWIHFDSGSVERMMLALAARAREILPEGGAVKVSTACVMGPQEVQGGVLPEGSYLRLRIEDDGVAMSDLAIAHIFEPFSDTATAGIRAGLELAAVYGVLSQGGGGVSVESGSDGTRFDLYFRSAPPSHSGHPPVASALSSNKTVRILLVDDQEQVRLFAADVLRDAGFEVTAVGDSAAALSILNQDGDGTTLLLTDVVMHGLSGRDLAVRARQIRPGLSIVFMSGYADEGPSVAELEAMGARFLQKPFSPDQLEAAIRAQAGVSRPARIVIADDDAGVRALLRTLLEGAGYDVVEAAEGAAGDPGTPGRTRRPSDYRPRHAWPGRNRDHPHCPAELAGFEDCRDLRCILRPVPPHRRGARRQGCSLKAHSARGLPTHRSRSSEGLVLFPPGQARDSSPESDCPALRPGSR